MKQEFNGSDAYINQDQAGTPREVIHTEQKYVSQADTSQQAAREYLERYGEMLAIKPEELKNLAAAPEAIMGDAPIEYRFYQEKSQFDMTTVAYQQTYLGLPVWEAGVAVHMKRDPFRIVSAQSTSHEELQVTRPSAQNVLQLNELTVGALARILGLSAEQPMYDLNSLKIEGQQLVIYRYEGAKRLPLPEPPPPPGESAAQEPEVHLSSELPTLPLPPVSDAIQEGQHYVCSKVDFALSGRASGLLHWMAMIEVNTLSVLYLRAFVDHVSAMVFDSDPLTSNGGPAPSASNASLNAVRVSVVLPGLVPPMGGGSQSLTGDIVQLSDVEAPTIAAPTEPGGTDFNFDARTDGFAAVNAYYHCDKFFRLLDGMGFTLAGYFGGTSFPSTLDHRGSISTSDGHEINAHCVGTSGGVGIARTTFMLADLGDTVNPIGIAADWRVVLHELGGHGVLYNHVHSPNFGFAHSAGDSIAAILNDPDSRAYNSANPSDPNRFITFPWVNIGRRHDRAVAAGWGWGGVNDTNGYSSEQILCTTHFRIYRSIGGDSSQVATRQFAARFTTYLILRAIGSLTPVTNPPNVSGYATALITADLGDWTTEGQSGGAYGKVIRWAFEKQGLYQPAGAPTPVTTEGAPPAVDVYIDDGRQGEYQYQPDYLSCQAVWNRHSNDGLAGHEDPIIGVTNYAYVKIKNRGTQLATNVVVKGFQRNPGTGFVWPNDLQPMSTAQLSAPDVAPNNSGEITVGPFEWVPSQAGRECMLMIVSATGDASNVDNFTAGDSIPEWRLVPHDNNIGERKVNLAPQIVVSGGPFTYDGFPHSATAVAKGAGGTAVSGTFTYTYNGSSTPPVNAGSYAVVATFTSSDPNYANATGSGTLTINRQLPVINWANPADIDHGTALGAAQLNATASGVVGGSTVTLPGTFTYDPPAGTLLDPGLHEPLSVNFVPADILNFLPASKTVRINVRGDKNCWTRIDLEEGHDRTTGARAGYFEIREVLTGRLLAKWYPTLGDTDSGCFSTLRISFKAVAVTVVFHPDGGGTPFPMKVLNPGDDAGHGWIALGGSEQECAAIEVEYP